MGATPHLRSPCFRIVRFLQARHTARPQITHCRERSPSEPPQSEQPTARCGSSTSPPETTDEPAEDWRLS